MQKTEEISVILPVYNGERFLRGAVESVLAQTLPEWELLIVDDGSKDASGAICDELAARDARIRAFHQPNGGVNAARAIGIDHARGEFLTFLDADDALFPHALAFMMSLFDEGVDLVANGRDDTILSKDAYVKRLWSQGTGPALWGKMFRASLFKQFDYALDRRMAMGEDLLLNSIYALYIDSARLFTRPVYEVNHDNETSVTKTFKHNWEYEKYFFEEVDRRFLSHCTYWENREDIRLLVNKSWLNAMKYVMLDGGSIDYKDPAFLAVRDYFKDHNASLGPSEKLIFKVRNPRLYRLILNTYLHLTR